MIKDCRSINVSAGDTGVVSLTWSAQAGGHSWRVEVWGDNQLEASRSGSLKVSSDNLIGRLMPNATSTVVSGTEVHFDVVVETRTITQLIMFPLGPSILYKSRRRLK